MYKSFIAAVAVTKIDRHASPPGTKSLPRLLFATMTQTAVPSRAWGTKIRPDDDTTQTPPGAVLDDVSWGDPARTGTAFDFRSESQTTIAIPPLQSPANTHTKPHQRTP